MDSDPHSEVTFEGETPVKDDGGTELKEAPLKYDSNGGYLYEYGDGEKALLKPIVSPESFTNRSDIMVKKSDATMEKDIVSNYNTNTDSKSNSASTLSHNIDSSLERDIVRSFSRCSTMSSNHSKGSDSGEDPPCESNSKENINDEVVSDSGVYIGQEESTVLDSNGSSASNQEVDISASYIDDKSRDVSETSSRGEECSDNGRSVCSKIEGVGFKADIDYSSYEGCYTYTYYRTRDSEALSRIIKYDKLELFSNRIAKEKAHDSEDLWQFVLSRPLLMVGYIVLPRSLIEDYRIEESLCEVVFTDQILPEDLDGLRRRYINEVRGMRKNTRILAPMHKLVFKAAFDRLVSKLA
jgi:hypothetical protein